MSARKCVRAGAYLVARGWLTTASTQARQAFDRVTTLGRAPRPATTSARNHPAPAAYPAA